MRQREGNTQPLKHLVFFWLPLHLSVTYMKTWSSGFSLTHVVRCAFLPLKTWVPPSSKWPRAKWCLMSGTGHRSHGSWLLQLFQETMMSPGNGFLPVMAASSSNEDSAPVRDTILPHRTSLPKQWIWNRLALVVDELDVASRTSKKTRQRQGRRKGR